MRNSLILFLLLTGAAALSAQEKENPVRWSLTAPKQARPGEKITARLEAHITEGWHLYSLKQQEGGPYPTSIGVPEGLPFRLAGEIDAPRPFKVKDESFDMDIEMYLADVTFGVPLEISSYAPAGSLKLTLTARYQACDNRQCLPPKTVRAEVPVEIRK